MKHLEKVLEKKANEGKESEARWRRDNPGRQPGYSLKTHKSYSKQRFTSDSYRRNFAEIKWH